MSDLFSFGLAHENQAGSDSRRMTLGEYVLTAARNFRVFQESQIFVSSPGSELIKQGFQSEQFRSKSSAASRGSAKKDRVKSGSRAVRRV